MEMYVLSTHRQCKTPRPPPALLDPQELLLHQMIVVVLGSIHLDYTDRNALIMICGRRSSEVCQKTLNVSSPAVVSDCHTPCPPPWLGQGDVCLLLRWERWSGEQAAADQQQRVCSGTRKQDGRIQRRFIPELSEFTFVSVEVRKGDKSGLETQVGGRKPAVSRLLCFTALILFFKVTPLTPVSRGLAEIWEVHCWWL